MTREELRQIYYLNKEIMMWEKELIHESKIAKLATAHKLNDKNNSLSTEKEEIEKIIKRQLIKTQTRCEKIVRFIDDIEDNIMHQITILRNIHHMTWEEVASKVGGENTGDSVKKAYYRFFIKK